MWKSKDLIAISNAMMAHQRNGEVLKASSQLLNIGEIVVQQIWVIQNPLNFLFTFGHLSVTPLIEPLFISSSRVLCVLIDTF